MTRKQEVAYVIRHKQLPPSAPQAQACTGLPRKATYAGLKTGAEVRMAHIDELPPSARRFIHEHGFTAFKRIFGSRAVGLRQPKRAKPRIVGAADATFD